MTTDDEISTHGMTEFRLVNCDTAEVATYTALDLQCAKLLAAEDYGGEPSDWEWQHSA